MSLYFTEEHEMFRRTVRRFVDEEINPNVDKWEKEKRFPAHELFKKAGELGMFGVSYPEEIGGMGLDYWFNVVMAEEMGKCDCAGVPMALAVHTDMATPAMSMFGSDEVKERFLKPAIRGDLVSAIAVSEADAGSDVASIRTRAKLDGDDFVINGSKMWITNGAQADFVTTLVRTSDESKPFLGMSLIVVPTDTKGFSVARTIDKLGNHSSDTAELYYEDVRVPQSYCIGAPGMGFMIQMQQFQKERLIGSVLGTSGAEKMVRKTIDYTRDRKIYGRPLIDYQWIHYKLGELLTEIEALRHLNYHCCRMMVAGQDCTKEVSMAKLKAGRLSRDVADTCMQFHGGMGYAEETGVARYFRDSRLISIGAGADEVMLGIIAKMEGILPRKY